ncbi:MAG: tetratricopeptide repeat protein, partial [Thermoanaerobaculia bacterium]
MKTRWIPLLLVALVAATGCTTLRARIDRITSGENPYSKPPFYMKYATTDQALDVQIRQTVDALRRNPSNPILHNQLGALLSTKGFPKDAEREFMRAVGLDSHLYPAWYNLGLAREARGNFSGALHAFRKVVDLKPGHPAAHFQLGLLYERRGSTDAAIDEYAKAISINPNLLEVDVNPRVLDSHLIDRALLRLYPDEHIRRAVLYQRIPAGMVSNEERPAEMEGAPSPQPPAEAIVPPAPPVTEQGVQKAPASPQPNT